MEAPTLESRSTVTDDWAYPVDENVPAAETKVPQRRLGRAVSFIKKPIGEFIGKRKFLSRFK